MEHGEEAAEVTLVPKFVTHNSQVLLWHPGMVLENRIFWKNIGKKLPWNGGIPPERECLAPGKDLEEGIL